MINQKCAHKIFTKYSKVRKCQNQPLLQLQFSFLICVTAYHAYPILWEKHQSRNTLHFLSPVQIGEKTLLCAHTSTSFVFELYTYVNLS